MKITLNLLQVITQVRHHGPAVKDSILGFPMFKPLTHFCFDLMAETGNDLETVALTCPRLPVETGVEIFKCCPFGETLSDGYLNSCRKRGSNHRHWTVPINGHLFTEKELKANRHLVYDPSKVILSFKYVLYFNYHNCKNNQGRGDGQFV